MLRNNLLKLGHGLRRAMPMQKGIKMDLRRFSTAELDPREQMHYDVVIVVRFAYNHTMAYIFNPI